MGIVDVIKFHHHMECTMSKIPEPCIEKLRSSGLFVSDPWPPSHVWPDNLLVGKPIGIAGNSIPGYTTVFGLSDDQIDFDAPTVRLFCEQGTWFVLAEDYCPAPGPGDFVDEWTTPDEAVEDILNFYFGNPQRMQAKADAFAHRARSQRD